MKSIFSLSLIVSASLLFLTIQPVFGEGGGGIECPEISGVYTYISGSALFQENPFEEGQLGVLFCEYETESEDENIEPFAEINAIFLTGEQLIQELIDEYGCGAILGEQFSPTYVSSTTRFASVAFSTAELLEAASNIMTQIEQQDLAVSCNQDSSGDTGGSTAESVKETIEEDENIQDSSIEISNEDIDESTLEIIKEKIEEGTKMDQGVPIEPKGLQIVLPNWIKDSAGWWSSDQISDKDFSLGIEYLIAEGIIVIPPTEVGTETSDEIPDWVKFNAGWWDEGLISDDEFINGLQFLISTGIISITAN